MADMTCQKCRTPLRLDASLSSPNPAALDLLVGTFVQRDFENGLTKCLGSAGQTVDESTGTSRSPFSQSRQDDYAHAAQHASSAVFKRTISAPVQGLVPSPSTNTTVKDNPAMSFVMLSESQLKPTSTGTADAARDKPSKDIKGSKTHDWSRPAALSRQAQSTSRLFEILSARSDLDHPICAECTDLLLSAMQARLTASNKERDAYIHFVKSLHNNVPTSSEVGKAQASLTAAKSTESKAFAALVESEKNKGRHEDDIAMLEAEALALDKEEAKFWISQNAFSLELSNFQDEYDALNAAYDHDANQLERLHRTNVYNDTFAVGHDGFFGTVNGLRLGRLPPPQNVDWSEINAAWGATALLLVTVAEKLGFQFRGYKIKPMGSASTIEKQDPASSQQSASGASRSGTAAHRPQAPSKSTSLDLISSGDLPLGRMILHRRIDAGMVAFLECLRQLGEFVERNSHDSTLLDATSGLDVAANQRIRDALTNRAALRLPYAIRKDKIGDASIRLSVSTDEAWTRACKYVLTCCKYLLAHASNVGNTVHRDGQEHQA